MDMNNRSLLREDEYKVESTPIKLKHFLSQRYLHGVAHTDEKGKRELLVLAPHTKKVYKQNYKPITLKPVLYNTQKVYNGKAFLLSSEDMEVVIDQRVKLSRVFINLNKEKKKVSPGEASSYLPLSDHEVQELNRVIYFFYFLALYS